MASFVQNKYRTQDEDGWRVCKKERGNYHRRLRERILWEVVRTLLLLADFLTTTEALASANESISSTSLTGCFPSFLHRNAR
jgi:hypothetical protein